MPLDLRLGKRAARQDLRVKRLSIAVSHLPTPPSDYNWYAAIGDWGMLGNDQVGDCVEAAILHCIQQFSTYAGTPEVPTDQEALAFYSAATGYDPTKPSTDQGSYVLGPDGVMQFWFDIGVTCGGVPNKVKRFLQITRKNPLEWMQGIYVFGGLLTGLALPEIVLQDPTAVWRDFSGPVAGGHEVWINGYETLNSGRYYDLISWGQRYRATEEFLLHCVDEMVVVVDEAEINARGLDGHDFTLSQLSSSMDELKKESV